MSRDFDVIIVGSGPGGATAADVLTVAGNRSSSSNADGTT